MFLPQEGIRVMVLRDQIKVQVKDSEEKRIT